MPKTDKYKFSFKKSLKKGKYGICVINNETGKVIHQDNCFNSCHELLNEDGSRPCDEPIFSVYTATGGANILTWDGELMFKPNELISIGACADDAVVVGYGSRWGHANYTNYNYFDLRTKKILFPDCDFTSAASLSTGFVMVGGKYNIALRDGSFLFDKHVDGICCYSAWNVAIVSNNGKSNVIDLKTKRLVFSEWYDHVTMGNMHPDNMTYIIRKDGNQNVITHDNVLISPNLWFDNISPCFVSDVHDEYIVTIKEVYKNGYRRTMNILLPNGELALPYNVYSIARIHTYDFVDYYSIRPKAKSTQTFIMNKNHELTGCAYNFAYYQGWGFDKCAIVASGFDADRKYNLMKGDGTFVSPKWFDFIERKGFSSKYRVRYNGRTYTLSSETGRLKPYYY